MSLKRFVNEHFPIKKGAASMATNTTVTCAVCQTEFGSKDEGFELLKCGHAMCYRDLLATVQNGHKKCPMCREDFNILATRLKAINSLFQTVARCYSCELEKKFDELQWCKDCCEALCKSCCKRSHAGHVTKRFKHERAAKFSLIYMQNLIKFRESQVEKETESITDYHRNVAKKVMNEFPEMLAKGLNEANQIAMLSLIHEHAEQAQKMQDSMKTLTQHHGPIEMKPFSFKLDEAQKFVLGRKDQFHKTMQLLMRFIDVKKLDRKPNLDLPPAEKFADVILGRIEKALPSLRNVAIQSGRGPRSSSDDENSDDDSDEENVQSFVSKPMDATFGPNGEIAIGLSNSGVAILDLKSGALKRICGIGNSCNVVHFDKFNKIYLAEFENKGFMEVFDLDGRRLNQIKWALEVPERSHENCSHQIAQIDAEFYFSISGTAFQKLDAIAIRTRSTLKNSDCRILFRDLDRLFTDGVLHKNFFYASDAKKKEICILGLDGTLVGTLGSGEFKQPPGGSAIDQNGNFLVHEGKKIMKVFDVETRKFLVDLFESRQPMHGILVADGFVYVCTDAAAYLQKVKYPMKKIEEIRKRFKLAEKEKNEKDAKSGAGATSPAIGATSPATGATSAGASAAASAVAKIENPQKINDDEEEIIRL